MSGIVAAAQSSGCCCAPMPSLGCRQTEAAAYLQAVDDFDELNAEMSIQFMRSIVYLQDCELNCTGASATLTAQANNLSLEKEAGGISWLTRVPTTAGGGSQSVGTCRDFERCCCRSCNDITVPCAPTTPCGGQFNLECCEKPFTVQVKPPYFCLDDYEDRNENSRCIECQPNQWINSYRQYASRAMIVTKSASLNFICGFGYSRPCGPNPRDATFCRFELTVNLQVRVECPSGGNVTSTGISYVKPCCDYSEGPVGIYTRVDGDPADFTFTDTNECRVISQTFNTSTTATVTRG